MTDLADRRWGHPLVRAPMAREAAPPGARRSADTRSNGQSNGHAGGPPPSATRAARIRNATVPPDGDETAAWPVIGDGDGAVADGVWDAAVTGVGWAPAAPAADVAVAPRPAGDRGKAVTPAVTNGARPPSTRTHAPARAALTPPRRMPVPPVAPTPAPRADRPAPAARSDRGPAGGPPVEGPDDVAARLGRLPEHTAQRPPPPTPAAGIPRLGVDRPAPPPAPDEPDEPSLARLARGIQDCARAVSGLADRLDVLERRLADGAVAPPAPTTNARNGDPRSRPRVEPPPRDDLEARVRALEGRSDDRLQDLDQRLRKLESLPVAVGRLQKDTAWLTDLATTKRVEDAMATRMATAAELTPVYQELDRVAEVVATHHAAASQSLERVRTLERAVLEMRRHVERNLADHARSATSEQAAVHDRIEALEANLAAGPTSDSQR